MALVNGMRGKHNVKSSVSLIICYDHKGAIKVNVKYGVKDFFGEKKHSSFFHVTLFFPPSQSHNSIQSLNV